MGEKLLLELLRTTAASSALTGALRHWEE